jgi:hypothetical protein
LPLARRFSPSVQHRVEPHVLMGARMARRRGAPLIASETGDAEHVALMGGLESSLGDRHAAELDVAGGLLGRTEAPEAVVSAELGADARWLAASVLSIWRAEADEAPVTFAEARFGRETRLHASAHAEGPGDVFASEARWARGADWQLAPTPWFVSDGWSGGASLTLPVTRLLSTRVGSEHDLTRGRWLAANASLAYRHPCGCLSALAWGGRRVGRGGFDAGLGVDLMP